MLSNPAAFIQIQTRLPLNPREALNSLKMLIFLINCKNEKRQTRYWLRGFGEESELDWWAGEIANQLCALDVVIENPGSVQNPHCLSFITICTSSSMWCDAIFQPLRALGTNMVINIHTYEDKTNKFLRWGRNAQFIQSNMMNGQEGHFRWSHLTDKKTDWHQCLTTMRKQRSFDEMMPCVFHKPSSWL